MSLEDIFWLFGTHASLAISVRIVLRVVGKVSIDRHFVRTQRYYSPFPLWDGSKSCSNRELASNVNTDPDKVLYMLSDFSEADLEVIAQEGQGPGGPLHKVKDTRTGTIMARKKIVISAGQDPMNQLLRELNTIRSNPHPNIILLYGAYTMNSYAPSYGTEVGLLLEYCPGRSLAAIEERMADRNGWVEEAVVGRLAEGVSPSP
jgi:hypothetical protein